MSQPIQRVGQYNFLKKLGIGRMAEVYLGRIEGAEGFQKPVAIKKILPHLSSDLQFVQSLIAEARVGGQLHHRNIVEVYDFIRYGNDYCIIMEYVDGVDLGRILRSARRYRVRIPPAAALYIASHICDGLDYAHSARGFNGEPLNIIHRDLKPSNVLISIKGGVKISDFGVARVMEQAVKRSSGDVKVSYQYQSPEQATGGLRLTAASDIFSVGVILFEMLTLEPLFPGKNVIEVLEGLREADFKRRLALAQRQLPGSEKILATALNPNPDARYRSAAQMAEDLRRLLLYLKVDDPRERLVTFFARLVRFVQEQGKRPASPEAKGAPEDMEMSRDDGPEMPSGGAYPGNQAEGIDQSDGTYESDDPAGAQRHRPSDNAFDESGPSAQDRDDRIGPEIPSSNSSPYASSLPDGGSSYGPGQIHEEIEDAPTGEHMPQDDGGSYAEQAPAYSSGYSAPPPEASVVPSGYDPTELPSGMTEMDDLSNSTDGPDGNQGAELAWGGRGAATMAAPFAPPTGPPAYPPPPPYSSRGEETRIGSYATVEAAEAAAAAAAATAAAGYYPQTGNEQLGPQAGGDSTRIINVADVAPAMPAYYPPAGPTDRTVDTADGTQDMPLPVPGYHPAVRKRRSRVFLMGLGLVAMLAFGGVVVAFLKHYNETPTIGEENQVTCPVCNNVLPGNAEFCPFCGASLLGGGHQENDADRVKCPKCGTLNEKEATFCGNCGEMLQNP